MHQFESIVKCRQYALALVLLGGVLVGCAQKYGSWQGGDEWPVEVEDSDARKRARLRLQLASGYFEQGQTGVALEEVRLALQIDPAFADAYNLRGLINMRLNDNRQAEDNFRRALNLNAKDANTAHNLGWLLCQVGRFPEAYDLFAQAVRQTAYAGRAKTYLIQGLCQVRAGNRGQAEASLKRSLELDPSNPAALYNLAALYNQNGTLQLAQPLLLQLNQSPLANAESLWLGIKVARRLGQTEDVRQLSEQLAKRFPQSTERSALQRGAYDE
jgi:type IV pilus assembly protein PilF